MNKSISSEHTEERSGKRRKVAAFLLAAVAIGGIGAGLTSAAWTDNTFFSASAAAATFNLQGSLDDTAWKESDDKNAIELQIPDTSFAKLVPGESRTVEVFVRTNSNVAATLTATPTWAASTFADNPTVEVTGTSTPLAGDTPSRKLTLTVTAPANWPTTNKGKSGTLVLNVAATTTTN